MPAKNHDLHGNVPESSPIALIMVDVINDLEFQGGDALLQNAVPMAERLAALASRARKANVPVIYVNDNFGKWRSDFREVLDHCMNDDVRGREVARLLAPEEADYFVLKPKHSGFFSTTLDTLLDYLHVDTVIIAGLTTDRCVLFTASDAHMRDLNIIVPRDCCAADSAQHHDDAITMIERILGADVKPSAQLDFTNLPDGNSRE